MKRYYDKTRQEWIPVQYKIGTPGQDGKDGADGKDGVDGLTPEFRIIDGILYVSYDSWNTKKDLGKVAGEDGSSINIKGTLNSDDELPNPPENPSDCYIIGQDLYVWDGDNWVNAGQFKGDPGDTIYLHVKYADSMPAGDDWDDWSENNGSVPSNYIGICTINDPEAPLIWTAYTWFKWKGEDGWGYEYIYCLTNTYNSPNVPKVTSNSSGKYATDDDFVPDGWFDNPPSVDEISPYCWMCSRKKINGVWTEFAGSNTEPNKATLWARWSFDGANGADGKDGENGQDGDTGSSVITFSLYCRSKETPTKPTNIICTFTDNTYELSGSTLWSQIIPTVDGNDLWVSTLTQIIDSESCQAGSSITLSGWSEPAIAMAATKGIDGKMLYPAGVWNAETEYKTTDTTRPYVIADSKYYYLNSDSSIGDTPGTKDGPWSEMEQVSAVYANVALIDYGKFGEAVFWKQFMFSEQGWILDGEGEDINDRVAGNDYASFLKSYACDPDGNCVEEMLDENSDIETIKSKSIFIPNMLFDFKTGNGWLGAGTIMFQNGTVTANNIILDNDLSTTDTITSDPTCYNTGYVNTFNVDLMLPEEATNNSKYKYRLLCFTEDFYNRQGNNKKVVDLSICNKSTIGQYIYFNPEDYYGLLDKDDIWQDGTKIGEQMNDSGELISQDWEVSGNKPSITFLNTPVQCIYIQPQQTIDLKITKFDSWYTFKNNRYLAVTATIVDTVNFYLKTINAHTCARQRSVTSLEVIDIDTTDSKTTYYIHEDGLYSIPLQVDNTKVYISPDCDTGRIIVHNINNRFQSFELYQYKSQSEESAILLPGGNNAISTIVLDFQRNNNYLFTTRFDFDGQWISE